MMLVFKQGIMTIIVVILLIDTLLFLVRYFEGVHNDTQRQGELFGIKVWLSVFVHYFFG